MTMVDIITVLFCSADDDMTDVPQHSQQALAPRTLVTIGLWHALKGVGSRCFYRCLSAHYALCAPICPVAPDSAASCAYVKTGQTVSWLHQALCV